MFSMNKAIPSESAESEFLAEKDTLITQISALMDKIEVSTGANRAIDRWRLFRINSSAYPHKFQSEWLNKLAARAHHYSQSVQTDIQKILQLVDLYNANITQNKRIVHNLMFEHIKERHEALRDTSEDNWIKSFLP